MEYLAIAGAGFGTLGAIAAAFLAYKLYRQEKKIGKLHREVDSTASLNRSHQARLAAMWEQQAKTKAAYDENTERLRKEIENLWIELTEHCGDDATRGQYAVRQLLRLFAETGSTGDNAKTDPMYRPTAP